jgi:hypothetical protein
MAVIPDNEVEELARALVRQTILASSWYPGVADEERHQLIEHDVDRHWPLMIDEARKRLGREGEA